MFKQLIQSCHHFGPITDVLSFLELKEIFTIGCVNKFFNEAIPHVISKRELLSMDELFRLNLIFSEEKKRRIFNRMNYLTSRGVDLKEGSGKNLFGIRVRFEHHRIPTIYCHRRTSLYHFKVLAYFTFLQFIMPYSAYGLFSLKPENENNEIQSEDNFIPSKFENEILIVKDKSKSGDLDVKSSRKLKKIQSKYTNFHKKFPTDNFEISGKDVKFIKNQHVIFSGNQLSYAARNSISEKYFVFLKLCVQHLYEIPNLVIRKVHLDSDSMFLESDNSTLLQLSCQYGRFRWVKFLVEFGGDLLFKCRRGKYEHSNLTGRLLDQKMKESCKDHEKTEESEKLSKFLVESYSQCYRSRSTENFLYLAIKSRNYELLEYLIEECCIDPNSFTKSIRYTGELALIHRICIRSSYHYNIRIDQENIKLIKLLLRNGAEIGIKDSKGRNCLHFCCKNGFKETFFFLISSGVEYVKDYEGRTPQAYLCDTPIGVGNDDTCKNRREILKYIEDNKL